MADGTVCRFLEYPVEVEWDGSWRTVLASGLGDETLIGMELLRGHDLKMKVVPGRSVEITPIP